MSIITEFSFLYIKLWSCFDYAYVLGKLIKPIGIIRLSQYFGFNKSE